MMPPRPDHHRTHLDAAFLIDGDEPVACALMELLAPGKPIANAVHVGWIGQDLRAGTTDPFAG